MALTIRNAPTAAKPTNVYAATVASRANIKGEKNDCSVISVSIATGLPYDKVYWEATKLGRKMGRGMRVTEIVKLINKLGFEIEPVKSYAKTVKSVAASLDKNSSYLVIIPRHILAVKNGRVEDWTNGKFLEIQQVWKISKKKS